MRGVWTQYKSLNITINNYGTIKTTQGSYQNSNGINAAHFIFEGVGNTINFQHYTIKITETQSEFNGFKGYTDKTNNKNSHLIIWFNNTDNKKPSTFLLGNLILDFGGEFELGKEYKIDKLITNRDGNNFNEIKVKSSNLALSDEIKDLYSLTNSGDSFIIRLINKIQETPITAIYKANIRTMNNFYTLSSSMIYPRKSYHSQNLGKKNQNNLVILRERSDRRISKSNIRDSSPKAQNDNIVLDSAIPPKSYESFAYRNESVNRRIQRQNKRNYSRTKRNNNSVILSESEESQKKNNRDSSVASLSQNDKMNRLQNLTQTPHNYYFILTPFLNYHSFAKSGNYNLSGFDYGFLTAFSTQVAESNSLGAHFIFSYGSLNDSKDKDLSIKSLNLNLGINYKLDLIYDMYLKARGDFYYFLNQVKTLTILEAIKPNNLGFGVSVAYGKDFNFGSGGVLGIEVGIDYKALKTNEVSLNSQTYKQSLLNLIYADLGVNYNKYFGGFGMNLGTGFKANLAPKLAESTLLINTQTLKFTLDNDKYLAYANAGISYVLNTKNFDMEFSLAYYGIFGDRVISNGGGVEFRVVW